MSGPVMDFPAAVNRAPQLLAEARDVLKVLADRSVEQGLDPTVADRLHRLGLETIDRGAIGTLLATEDQLRTGGELLQAARASTDSDAVLAWLDRLARSFSRETNAWRRNVCDERRAWLLCPDCDKSIAAWKREVPTDER